MAIFKDFCYFKNRNWGIFAEIEELDSFEEGLGLRSKHQLP